MKVYLCVTVILLLCTSALGVCPSGWIYNGDLCYFLFEDRLDRLHAEAFCQSHQGQLVSYKDLGQWTYISKLVELSSYGDEGSWTDLSYKRNWAWKNQGYHFVDLNNWAKATRKSGIPLDTGARLVLQNGKVVLAETVPSRLLHPFCQRRWDAMEPCNLRDGWALVNDRCYKLFQPTQNVNMLVDCESHKAKIFTPSNARDMEVVKKEVANTEFENGTVFVNADRIAAGTNRFSTSGNVVVTFLPWFDNKIPSKVSPNNCLGWVRSPKSSGYVLVNCGSAYPFICVKDKGSCPLGWYQVDQDCYRWYLRPEDKVTWPVAVDRCKSQGTKMIQIIHSAAAKSLLRQELVNNNIDSVWLGFQESKEGAFKDLEGNIISATVTSELTDDTAQAPSKQCGITDFNPKRKNPTIQYCFDQKNYVCTVKVSNSKLKTPPGPEICADGWTPFYKFCFKLLPDKYDYDGSIGKCGLQLGTLPIVNNDLEQSFVSIPGLPSTDYWLGVRYDLHQFKLSNGKMVTYKNSLANADTTFLRDVAPCIYVGAGGFVDYPGRWISSPCSAKKSVICMNNAIMGSPPKPPAFAVIWSPGCGPGWFYNNATGVCYWVEKFAFKSWQEARVICQQKSSELVSIENLEEQEFVASILGMPDTHDVMEPLWTGASDYGDYDGWIWSDEKPFVFTRWQEAQPIYRRSHGNCASISSYGDYRWEANDCSQVAPYICKKYAQAKQNKKTTTEKPHTTTVPKNLGCKPGWLAFRDSCYFVSSQTTKTWQKAKEACQAMNSDLADVNNREENNMLRMHILYHQEFVKAWISLHYSEDTSSFVLSPNATAPKYVTWAYHQPSLNLGLETQSVLISNRGWINSDAQDMHHFICKTRKSIVKTPGTIPVDKGCDKGWYGLRDKCIKFSTDVLEWNAAYTKCKGLNANMMHIRDGLENTFLSGRLAFLKGQYWIGVSSSANAPDQMFQDVIQPKPNLKLQTLSYTNWESQKPDRNGECVCLGSQDKGGLWTNSHCSYKKNYICQKPRQGGFSPSPSPSPRPSTGACPAGWKLLRSACYKFFSPSELDVRMTWYESRQQCHDQGADLASFHNPVDFNIFLRGLKHHAITQSLWIGLNTFDSGKGFQWTDESAMDYVAWDIGQPKDDPKRGLCGEMHVKTNQSSGNGILMPIGISMRLQRCSVQQGWICSIKKGQTQFPPKKVFPQPVRNACGDDRQNWVKFGNHCYYVSSTAQGSISSKTWMESSTWCQMKFGHLASINSKDENDFIWGQAYTTVGTAKAMWIGLNELGQGYSWTDGTPVGRDWKLNWNDNEPNNKYGLEACTALQIRNGKWNDQHCGLKQGFVCKGPVKLQEFVGPTTTPSPHTKKTIPKGGCPKGFQKSGTKCFRLYGAKKGEKRLTWKQAVHFCNVKITGKHCTLASISSGLENDAVMLLLRQSRSSPWLGLKRNENTHNYLWSDNTDLTFEAWDNGQPNSGRGDDSCVFMRGSTSEIAYHAGRWGDAECDDLKSYICQTDIDKSIPSPRKIASGLCGKGYYHYGDSCLKVVTPPASRLLASSVCGKDGGYLVSVMDRYDVAQIRILVQNVAGGLWTGLNDIKVSGVYEWDSLEPVTLTPWAKNAPDDRQGKRCVYITPKGSLTNLKCGERMPYICQRRDGILKEVAKSGKSCTMNGFQTMGSFCYYVQRESSDSTYDKATQKCKNRGAFLASVRYANFSVPITRGTYAWIGLRQSLNGMLSWSNGMPVAFTNWETGQPVWNPIVSKQCVAMGSDHKWRVMNCASKLGYICMRTGVETKVIEGTRPPTTPTPSTTSPATTSTSTAKTTTTTTPTTTTAPTTTTTTTPTTTTAPTTTTTTTPTTTTAPPTTTTTTTTPLKHPSSKTSPTSIHKQTQPPVKSRSTHSSTSNKPPIKMSSSTPASTTQSNPATSSQPISKQSQETLSSVPPITLTPKTHQQSTNKNVYIRTYSSSSGLSSGAKAGIGVGVVAIVVLVVAGIIIGRKKGYLHGRPSYNQFDQSDDPTTFDTSPEEDTNDSDIQGQGQGLELRWQDNTVTEGPQAAGSTHWQDPTMSGNPSDSNSERIHMAIMANDDSDKGEPKGGPKFNSEC